MSYAKVLERACTGERLSSSEIVRLYDAPLNELQSAAHQARLRRADPQAVYYLVGGVIDYTNVCTVACGFCYFYRPKNHPEAKTLSFDEIRQQMEEIRAYGGTYVLIQGGVNPNLPFSWYTDLLRLLKREFPEIHVAMLSPEEIYGLEQLTGRSAEALLAELRNSGLDSLPGASAEILSTRVRKLVSPNRVSVTDWVRIVETSLKLGIPSSWVSMVFGLGETREEKVQHLLILREIQDRALEKGYPAKLSAFKVWPMRLATTRTAPRVATVGGAVYPINLDQAREVAEPVKNALIQPEEVRLHYLREVAIARLALDNIPNHGALWLTMGFETAAKALRGGANDMQETGAINAVNAAVLAAKGELPKVDENLLAQINQCIRNAGFSPVRRDGLYNQRSA